VSALVVGPAKLRQSVVDRSAEAERLPVGIVANEMPTSGSLAHHGDAAGLR
jgi:hypothetical protein